MRRRATAASVALLCVGVAVMAAMSLAIGSGDVPVPRVLAIVTGQASGTVEASIVLQQRLPRTCVAIIAGSALGVAGALSQSLTRNPLAEPGTLGVSSGASLALVVSLLLLPGLSIGAQLGFAMVGAAASGAVVLAIGGVMSGRTSTVRLVLAGAAWSALASALTQYCLLGNPRTFESFRYWHAGSVGSRPWELILVCAVVVFLGIVAVWPLAGALDALSLGDDLGRSLGARSRETWAFTGVIVIALTSSATALTGPLAFLGLAAPQLVRWVTGPKTLSLTLGAAVVGGAMLLGLDVAGRVLLPPREVSAGVMCGLVGAPVFIAVARRARAVWS